MEKYHENKTARDEEYIRAYRKYHSQTLAAKECGVGRETIMRAVRRADSKYGYLSTCKYCEKVFTTSKGCLSYCSKRCRDNASKVRRGIAPTIDVKKECPVCGVVFTTPNKRKIYCTKRCSDKANDRKKHRSWDQWKIECEQTRIKNQEQKERERREYIKAHTVKRICSYCGEEFMCYDKLARTTCSKECSRKLKNIRREDRIPKSQKVDRITLKRLYKRDKGICYLCGGVCDWNSKNISKKGNVYPGDEYPTIEHIIPISKGGMDAWDNVALAHWKCNLNKADGIIKTITLDKEFAYSEKPYVNRGKKTAQYDLSGNLIKIWDSTAQIEREMGLNSKSVQEACLRSKKAKRLKTGNAFGYHWEYVEHEDNKLKGVL